MTSPLIEALLSTACYTHPVTHVKLMETHISWVLLTGQHAYKIKKPLNLGFLDFSTLEARRRCCEEELRLNRRLAPGLYEAVVKITGSPAAPRMDGNGEAIEYAVRMHQFVQDALAGRLLAADTISGAQIDVLAADTAAFHACAGVAARGSPHGAPETVIASARENFITLERFAFDAETTTRIAGLRAWTEREYQARLVLFTARQTAGRVRDGHGDLHLGNIVMLDGRLTPFDCIEFNPALRWIDVMNEVAFLMMDLMDRKRDDFAWRFLNAYLETTGDFAGVDVLRFYLVYRALVRAKVHGLRATQDGLPGAERSRLLEVSAGYVQLAQRCVDSVQPAIILMHGLSGSGKSVVAQAISQTLGAVRVRSDIERKRLAGIPPRARSDSTLASGLYSSDLTAATYDRLLDIARGVAHAGYAAIVDATFLKRWQRDVFRRQARARGIPFVIVDVTAPEAALRARIAARSVAGTDASEADQAVLTHQLTQIERLIEDELADVLQIDTSRADGVRTLHEAGELLRKRIGRCSQAGAPAITI